MGVHPLPSNNDNVHNYQSNQPSSEDKTVTISVGQNHDVILNGRNAPPAVVGEALLSEYQRRLNVLDHGLSCNPRGSAPTEEQRAQYQELTSLHNVAIGYVEGNAHAIPSHVTDRLQAIVLTPKAQNVFSHFNATPTSPATHFTPPSQAAFDWNRLNSAPAAAQPQTSSAPTTPVATRTPVELQCEQAITALNQATVAYREDNLNPANSARFQQALNTATDMARRHPQEYHASATRLATAPTATASASELASPSTPPTRQQLEATFTNDLAQAGNAARQNNSDLAGRALNASFASLDTIRSSGVFTPPEVARFQNQYVQISDFVSNHHEELPERTALRTGDWSPLMQATPHSEMDFSTPEPEANPAPSPRHTTAAPAAFAHAPAPAAPASAPVEQAPQAPRNIDTREAISQVNQYVGDARDVQPSVALAYLNRAEELLNQIPNGDGNRTGVLPSERNRLQHNIANLREGIPAGTMADTNTLAQISNYTYGNQTPEFNRDGFVTTNPYPAMTGTGVTAAPSVAATTPPSLTTPPPAAQPSPVIRPASAASGTSVARAPQVPPAPVATSSTPTPRVGSEHTLPFHQAADYVSGLVSNARAIATRNPPEPQVVQAHLQAAENILGQMRNLEGQGMTAGQMRALDGRMTEFRTQIRDIRNSAHINRNSAANPQTLASLDTIRVEEPARVTTLPLTVVTGRRPAPEVPAAVAAAPSAIPQAPQPAVVAVAPTPAPIAPAPIPQPAAPPVLAATAPTIPVVTARPSVPSTTPAITMASAPAPLAATPQAAATPVVTPQPTTPITSSPEPSAVAQTPAAPSRSARVRGSDAAAVEAALREAGRIRVDLGHDDFGLGSAQRDLDQRRRSGDEVGNIQGVSTEVGRVTTTTTSNRTSDVGGRRIGVAGIVQSGNGAGTAGVADPSNRIANIGAADQAQPVNHVRTTTILSSDTITAHGTPLVASADRGITISSQFTQAAGGGLVNQATLDPTHYAGLRIEGGLVYTSTNQARIEITSITDSSGAAIPPNDPRFNTIRNRLTTAGSTLHQVAEPIPSNPIRFSVSTS